MLTREIVINHSINPKKSTRDLVVEAHSKAAKTFQGSSTIVTVKLVNDQTFSTTTIGDSGYALFHVNP